MFPTLLLAQPADDEPINGFKPLLPALPRAERKTQQEVRSFIESLSTNDGSFEVKVGQSRLMTLTQDLAVVDRQATTPIIAVSDPTIIDFVVLSPRHIRVTGARFGTTDLSILTRDRDYLSFEVNVVADLDVLRARLKEVFPDAQLKLAQLRDHLIVEGTAKSVPQSEKIIQTIEAYLLSLQPKLEIEEEDSSRSRGGDGAGGGDGGPAAAAPEVGGEFGFKVTPARAQIINLIRVSAIDDLDVLLARLKALYPDSNVEIKEFSGKVIIEGTAGNLVEMAEIRKLVEAYTAKGTVVDLLRVPLINDLDLLRARLKQMFPNAGVRLSELRGRVIVEGQARNVSQANQILKIIESYSTSGTPGANVVNMLRVPGPQQVMLKVQIAELNRTAVREFGNSFIRLGGGTISAAAINGGFQSGTGGGGGGMGMGPMSVAQSFIASIILNPSTTIFGTTTVLGENVSYAMNLLRDNNLLKILAEPNLVAYNGQEASFLAGGEFPIPVPQPGGGGAAITIQFKEFGVKLKFTPDIIDEKTIRLSVDPEVSTIDFSLGTSILGTTVPGVSTRKVHTVVELEQGQTLAIAGLLQLSIDADTRRIPGMGDLPYIGPFFSNNTHRRIEKELLVFVTPYLVSGMKEDELPPLPGSEVEDPNDLEFYFLGRIEGRTGKSFRPTTNWDDPLGLVGLLKLESKYIHGPIGYSQ